MAKEATYKIGDVDVTLYCWDLRKQLREQNVIIPLVKEPFINAMSMNDEVSEDVAMLAALDGILDALSEVDFEKLVSRLLHGVWIHNEKGIKTKEAQTIEDLEAAGMEVSDVLLLCFYIIKLNYESALKKDLLASLITGHNNLAPEKSG